MQGHRVSIADMVDFGMRPYPVTPHSGCGTESGPFDGGLLDRFSISSYCEVAAMIGGGRDWGSRGRVLPQILSKLRKAYPCSIAIMRSKDKLR